MEAFRPHEIVKTPYLFFTGKGGVGKTSTACATAISLADAGRRVLLVSTDPASNLQDVFAMELGNKPTQILDAPNLWVVNLDPMQAAAEYRESVVAPYRGKLPPTVIANMEEQLSGSCTVEIAAFNEFCTFLTDDKMAGAYDHILFDTAPTGHTLRMLQLPAAWSGFISESTHGASCLGQLSGLEGQRAVYRQAVDTLADGKRTTLLLVTRPEDAPLQEAARAAGELAALGVNNQVLVVNGLLEEADDALSIAMVEKQKRALEQIPAALHALPQYAIPLRGYGMTGLTNIRNMLTDAAGAIPETTVIPPTTYCLSDVVDQLAQQGKRVIFAMGKGGVGKTTVAAAIARGLAEKGQRVHLTTTDPAHHLHFVMTDGGGITTSHIDQEAELKQYRDEVLEKARSQGLAQKDIDYIEEDLRSPCTQEIAVFRAFAQVVERASEEVVVIDTAPTGHTLLLLESTQSYHHEIQRTKGEIPPAVEALLPRLKGPETAVVIVTLPEATPVYEALRLEEDLKRAGIPTGWWVINQSLGGVAHTNKILSAKAASEGAWIAHVATHANGQVACIPWQENMDSTKA